MRAVVADATVWEVATAVGAVFAAVFAGLGAWFGWQRYAQEHRLEIACCEARRVANVLKNCTEEGRRHKNFRKLSPYSSNREPLDRIELAVAVERTLSGKRYRHVPRRWTRWKWRR